MDVSERFAARKARVAEIRHNIAGRFREGERGLPIAMTLGRQFSDLVIDIAGDELPADLAETTAIVAVGGTGRGVMAPHSDVDLMLLGRTTSLAALESASPPFVQAIWDAGLRLGQSVRTVRQSVALAEEDDKTATSFLSTRCLWGSERLHERFVAEFRRRVVDRSHSRFTERCVAARKSEFTESHPATQLLEPNVKTSLGGLRDIQLLMWIADAHYRTSDFFTLQLVANVLSQIDAKRLSDAYEFLLAMRGRLHLWADGPQDLLTRAAQLGIAEAAEVEPTETQRSVELLMQQYFRHTTAVAAIVERFVNRHRPRPLLKKVREIFRERRVDGKMIVGPLRVDAHRSHHAKLTESVESILRVYEVASANGVPPSPTLSEAIRISSVQLMHDRAKIVGEADTDLTLSETAQVRFRTILETGPSLADTLRHMANTGAIDLVLPEWAHVRGLLQFNQYHQFTVDEHTLRAVGFLTRLDGEDSPAGRAYRSVGKKALLHLAIVLHDIGNGYEEDHCLVGERIAEVVGPRLGFSTKSTSQLAELVRWHLELPDIALRRDLTDETLLVDFARKVGTTETLTMLHCLVVADIRGVGPGKWTDWKGELLADLHRRTQVIVSGQPYRGFEQEQMERLIDSIATQPVPNSGFASKDAWAAFVREQVPALSSYYLSVTPPETIASDLARLRELSRDEIEIATSRDPASQAVDFRVFLHEDAARDCFYRLCGVLTARSFQIVDAEISTTADGFVVDGFRAIPPASAADRLDDYLRATERDIRSVLQTNEDITDIFHKHERYGIEAEDIALASELPNRVELDADSSETSLIIDVFSQDRRGLLYTLAKAIRGLDLDVELAKIGTHFDQVIDVFYVTELDGSKPEGRERLTQISDRLRTVLDKFQEHGFRDFRRSSTTLFASPGS